MTATILIVDDEENFRQTVVTLLNSRGYETIAVATLAEARPGDRQGTPTSSCWMSYSQTAMAPAC